MAINANKENPDRSANLAFEAKPCLTAGKLHNNMDIAAATLIRPPSPPTVVATYFVE